MGLLELYDYALIHFMVQLFCANMFDWEMEVYVRGGSGRGYLDLLDPTTNEYYEVKSKAAYERGAHLEQMAKYDVSVVQDTVGNRRMQPLNVGQGVKQGTRYVDNHFEYGFYDIHYYSIEPGLIVYETSFNYTRAAIGLSIVLLCTLTPEILPFLAAAGPLAFA